LTYEHFKSAVINGDVSAALRHYRSVKKQHRSVNFHILSYKLFCDIAEHKRSQYHYAVLKKHCDKVNSFQLSFILERLFEQNQYAEAISFLTDCKNTTTNYQIDAELARVYQFLGRHSEANKILQNLIDLHGFDPKVFRLLSTTYSPVSSKDEYLKLAIRTWNNNSIDAKSKVQLGFAISKLLLQIGDLSAFNYLNICNRLQSQIYPYQKELDRYQTHALINAQKSTTCHVTDPAKFTPIFICSMPRSGTTLLEKILCENGGFLAGGEVGVGMKLVKRHFSKDGMLVPINKISPLKIKKFASDYERELDFRNLASNSYIVDKSMATFSIMPYVALAIPNAKFVVLHRDIREVALSLYTNFFEFGTHRYSNAWDNILFRIRLFRETVSSFHDVMDGRVLNVSYSNLVESTADTQSKIFEFVGADISSLTDTVSQSYTTRTLSVNQVRNRVHSDSREKWRIYEDKMVDFLSLLEDDDF
jgi:hypothetical protein